MTSKLVLLLVLLLPVYAIDAKLSKEREGIDSISNLDNSPKAEPSSKCPTAGRSLEKLIPGSSRLWRLRGFAVIFQVIERKFQ